MKTSAGLLPFRRLPDLMVLIAHPGGPFWAARQAGAWSIVKGELAMGEEPVSAAAREFGEETGWCVPDDAVMIALGSVSLKSRKLVHGWAFEMSRPFDPATLRPGTFQVERRGVMRTFPEIDRVGWFTPTEAAELLNPAQVAFVTRLLEALDIAG